MNHMMLVLQDCRILELGGHGGIYQDFKGRSGGQANCSRVGVPVSTPCEGNVWRFVEEAKAAVENSKIKKW